MALFKSQPKAFRMIFLLEIWERFGYYTVQGILTLFFIRHLSFTETEAYYTFGAFFALVYGLVAVGGYLGDQVLGTKRTIWLGLITLAAGYLSLSLVNGRGVFLALGLVCVGNGLFKANPPNLLAKNYEKHDLRLHGAFTLYYMAVNLGSTVALILGPYLSANFGYFYAYFASFIGILLALFNFIFQQHYIKNINNEADAKNLKIWQWILTFLGIGLLSILSAFLLEHTKLAQLLLYIGCALVLIIYIQYLKHEERIVRLNMIVALILMFEGGLFFVLYQQMPTSLNLFAVNHVNPVLFGFTIDPQTFQVLNPIWIIFLSPVMAYFYQYLNQRKISFPMPYKFAAGMITCGLSFIVLFFSRYFHDASGIVSSKWMVLSYFFQTTGELLVSALGVAMIAELVPLQIAGFVMGMWYTFTAVAGFAGAYVATLTVSTQQIVQSLDSLLKYTSAFLYIGLATTLIGIILCFIAKPLSRIIAQANGSKS